MIYSYICEFFLTEDKMYATGTVTCCKLGITYVLGFNFPGIFNVFSRLYLFSPFCINEKTDILILTFVGHLVFHRMSRSLLALDLSRLTFSGWILVCLRRWGQQQWQLHDSWRHQQPFFQSLSWRGEEEGTRVSGHQAWEQEQWSYSVLRPHW